MLYTFILFSIFIYNANSSLLPRGSNSGIGTSPTFIHRGGSTKALDKDAISQLDRQRRQKSAADGSIQNEDDTDNVGCNSNDVNLKASEQEDIATEDEKDTDTQLYVTKRDGRIEPLDKNKVRFYCIDHEPYTKLIVSFNSLLISLSLTDLFSHNSTHNVTKTDIKTSTKSINKLKHKVSKFTSTNIPNNLRIISKHYNLSN